MNLKEEIRKIAELQRIDSLIYNLCQEKEIQIPAQIEELSLRLKERKEALSNFGDKIKQLQLKRKDRELELASKEEGISKIYGQLYQLKTNKEYQAKLTEISSLKADVSILEEEVIKVLDEIESFERSLKDEKEKFIQEEEKFKEEEAKLRGRTKELEARVKTEGDKRNLLAKDVDRDILSKYEKLLNSRSGLAIVGVKNENCGACHIRLTPQTINEIKMYKDLVFCGNCVRVLYIPEDI